MEERGTIVCRGAGSRPAGALTSQKGLVMKRIFKTILEILYWGGGLGLLGALISLGSTINGFANIEYWLTWYAFGIIMYCSFFYIIIPIWDYIIAPINRKITDFLDDK